MRDPVIAIGMNALTVAMKAKCNALPADDVAELVTDAGELLLPDQPVHVAVMNFATGFELYVDDAAYLRNLGITLHEAIGRAVQFTPPGINRRDIHG